MNTVKTGMETAKISDFMSSGESGVTQGKADASASPFVMIINNMLASMTENGEIDLDDNALFSNLKDGTFDAENFDSSMLGELAMLLNIQNPFLVAGKEGGTALTENQIGIISDILNARQSAATNGASNAQFDAEAYIDPQALKQSLGKVTVTTEKSVSGEGLKSLMETQANFLRYTTQARKDLENGNDNQNEQPLMSLEKPNNAEQTSHLFEKKLGNFANAPALQDQIANGIKENLSLQKTEFTIKLNPESLGEITVKLIEDDGNKTLQIFAAGAKTAGLINDELNGLREALRPMQVEVKDTVVATSESSGSSLEHFDMMGQNFANRQNQGENQDAWQDGEGDQQFVEIEAQDETIDEMGNLSMYV